MFDENSDSLWPVTLEAARLRFRGAGGLDGLSLTLEPGGVTALMGPNGAGKSLTLRLIAGLIAPQSGRLGWAGAGKPPRGAIGLVFQRPVLLRRSAGANLLHALGLAGMARAERAAARDALLARCGLAHCAARPARALSGGEQQRLAFARALAFRPRLLLLDEPTASLDPAETARLEALIAEAAREGVTALLVTHDPAQARRLADRILFLHRGKLAEAGPAARLDAPKSAELRAYLAGDLLV